MRRDVTMSGANLPKTRDIASYDHERGKVGWAHWRTRKKQATAQYRRRTLDRVAVQEQADQDNESQR